MTTPTDPDAPPPPTKSGLAGLAAMSTTAGVGLAEYRAVSGIAVASLLCAVAGAAVALSWVFVALPAIAVLLGLIALWQIRRASGTLIGRPLAWLGIALGVLIVSWFAWQSISTRSRDAAYRTDVAARVEAFGDAMAAQDYTAAHNMLAPVVKARTSPNTFASLATTYNQMRRGGELLFGPVTGAEATGRTLIVRDGTNVGAATEMTMRFESGADDAQRIELILDPATNTWGISSFARWEL